MMKKLTMLDKDVFERFVHPGEVIEIRALGCFEKRPELWSGYAKGIVSGYFDNHNFFCASLKGLINLAAADPQNRIHIYMTLQVINPHLLARANNRLIATSKTTADKDVIKYRWLPIDLDPVRPSGISSSDEELEKARQLSEFISIHLSSRFSSPIKAMSGNGYHLLYPLRDLIEDLSAQNKQTQNQVKEILEALSSQFSNEYVQVDTTLFNPSRIIKLYGTTACKGDPVSAGPNQQRRPHRQSYIYCLGEK
jgi:hypothetical protein